MQTQEKAKEIILKIVDERKWVDVKPYSHNTICCYLKMYEDLLGEEATHQLMRNLKLTELGWVIPENV